MKIRLAPNCAKEFSHEEQIDTSIVNKTFGISKSQEYEIFPVF